MCIGHHMHFTKWTHIRDNVDLWLDYKTTRAYRLNVIIGFREHLYVALIFFFVPFACLSPKENFILLRILLCSCIWTLDSISCWILNNNYNGLDFSRVKSIWKQKFQRKNWTVKKLPVKNIPSAPIFHLLYFKNETFSIKIFIGSYKSINRKITLY